MDPRYVNLDERRGPSLALGTQLCAGVAAAEALKLILGRGPVYPAPYRCRYVRGKLRWGNRGPLLRLPLRAAAALLPLVVDVVDVVGLVTVPLSGALSEKFRVVALVFPGHGGARPATIVVATLGP